MTTHQIHRFLWKHKETLIRGLAFAAQALQHLPSPDAALPAPARVLGCRTAKKKALPKTARAPRRTAQG